MSGYIPPNKWAAYSSLIDLLRVLHMLEVRSANKTTGLTRLNFIDNLCERSGSYEE